jgi:hypothetical protein
MLGCIQPMSSPMMNMMLGFLVSWACIVAVLDSRLPATAIAAVKNFVVRLISNASLTGPHWRPRLVERQVRAKEGLSATSKFTDQQI